MSDPPSIPRLVAILIGINKYSHFDPLKSAATDATELKTFLTDEFKADPKDITLLTDSKATRDNIIDALESLKKTPERDNAILFFFSGYAGQAQAAEDNALVGMICPADMDEDDIPGIPDRTLIQLFDNISKARGNNIAVFLDCASRTFKWENPISFVVVAPERATETKGGGAFTKSLINVLRSEKDLIQSLTVQTFADKIQADMGGNVHCYGQNVDRVLFNPAKGKAYRVFISGNIEKGGHIRLAAGSAHGVQKGTTYGIYWSNVQAKVYNKLGSLVVSSVDDATSATLCFPKGKLFLLPTVFYAVEIRYPDEEVAIFFPDASPSDIATIEPSPSWKRVEESKDANITLKFAADSVSFYCHGVVNDPEGMRDPNPGNLFTIPIHDQKRIMRMIRNAARFMYHLTRSPSDRSSLSVGMQLQHVDHEGQASGIDILLEGLAEVNVVKGKGNDSFCLILHNNSNVAVWPFVFRCDLRFNILPWYIPNPATMEAPFKPGEDLIVGCGNDDGLQFQWRPERTTELFYVKIFLTTERTNFSSLIQFFKSPFEDKLREANNPHVEPYTEGSDGDTSGNALSPSGEIPQADEEEDDVSQTKKSVGGSQWASMRITIMQKFTDNHGENEQ